MRLIRGSLFRVFRVFRGSRLRRDVGHAEFVEEAVEQGGFFGAAITGGFFFQHREHIDEVLRFRQTLLGFAGNRIGHLAQAHHRLSGERRD